MKFPFKRITLFLILAVVILSASLPAQAISPDIVISQVYGGGGNSGATYTNDFIELFNRGTSPVNIAGWSVQYASASGTSWTVTALSGTVQPGQYYLVQEAAGAGGTTSLPTPDAIGSIAMSASSGKLVVANTSAALSGSNPSDASIVDVVGYGSANFFEGAGAAPGLSNTTSDSRADNGCTDTDQNASDFASGPVAPRNSASPLNVCNAESAPSVTSTSPANNDGNVAVDANITIDFSEDVNVSGSWFDITCTNSGLHTAVASGGPQNYMLDPDSDFDISENCTVTIFAAQVTDIDTNDPPDNMSADFVFSFDTAGPPTNATLVINEVDYDQPSTDAAEFVEIKNTGPDSANLSEYELILINGNGGAIYQTFALPSITLAADDYFVVCGDAANVPNCDLDVSPDTNLIQNGTPDAVGLRHNGGLVDAVSYEGSTVAPYTEGSGAGLEDDPAFDFAGISRCADGVDTDQNNVDFTLRLSTPGTANACLPVVVINEIDYDQPGTDAAEFIEIRNNDIISHNLDNFTLELVNGSGGGAAVYNTIDLPDEELAAGEYFVVCANSGTVANCDLDASPDTNFIQNGAPDAVGLRADGSLIDAVSYEGDAGAPYTEGSGTGLEDPGSTGSDNISISRCIDGIDTNQNNIDLRTDTNTPGEANTCIVDAPPTVDSTNPVDGTPDASIHTNIVINFSEDVTVSGSWYDITCTLSGSHTAVVSGGPQNYTLNPDVSFTDGESCTVTISAANVSDLDGAIENMAADYDFSFTAIDVCVLPYTPVYEIQGSGLSAAITGNVTTQGVVVGDYEGPSPTLRGFYIQDATGDADSSTSDGIFVFNFDNNNVNLGDVVRVTGSAGEFQDQTQISSVSSIAACGTSSVTPVDVTLPVPTADYLEQYEGMLVRFPQTLYVTEHFQLGRFGQVVLSADGRLQQPTNVTTPGTAANALQAANDLNRIILDDDLQNQNPDPILFGRGGLPLSASNTLRGGDTATDIVGVMTYTWAGNAASGNAYRLRPINAQDGHINFDAANPRPTSAPEVGGRLKVVGMNLLNFFNTFGNGACTGGVAGPSMDCRGADDAFEFGRQWPKTVAAILAMDADVIGVNEIENDGYDSASSLQFLVDQLNTATSPGTYAFIDVDVETGQLDAMGSDAIRVALIYKPGSVTPVGQTAALNSIAFINGGDSGPRNRASLAQAFEENATGEVFIVNVNHLKSKGSACDDADAGDGQGNCNIVRNNAVNELLIWFAGDPTGTGDPDILMIGDYNSYAMEDPITTLQTAGYTNLIATLLGPDAYSYVFDGQWGYLDQALASTTLVSQVSGVGDYHINADEPGVLDYNDDFKSPDQINSLYSPDEFRVSDHDPVIVGLNLNRPPICSAASPSIDTLWPANHQFVPVTIQGVTDPNGDPISILIDSIFQDEAVNAPDSGQTSPDGQGVGTSTAEVRAERVGTANGRVYHISFTASDGQGNACSGEVLVNVPLNQGNNGAAVDDGPLFDSTVTP